MAAQPVFYNDREQRQVEQLMLVLRPDGLPLFRNRGEALAALRRLQRVTLDRARTQDTSDTVRL